ncbi:MAG: ACP S-malonyltransferase [Rhodospirillaceae bacterium]
MSRIAGLFPGQGTQKVGMGGAYFDRYPELVGRADAVLGPALGGSLKTLCLEDPDGRLAHTDWAQPAIFLVSALALEDWRAQHGGSVDLAFAAGHSLGEYAALYAAGALGFETALAAVRKRGEVMASAGPGAMAAVRGLSKIAIEAVIRDQALLGQAVVANDNTPDQIVISGAKPALEALMPALEAAGAGAVIPLKVLSAFHSPLMADPARAFAMWLEGLDLAAPQIPVISNVTARPHGADPDRIRRLLAAHFTAPVRWVESVRCLEELGATDFVELGEGQVLTRMVSAIQAAPKPAAKLPVPAQATVKAPVPSPAPAPVPSPAPAPVPTQARQNPAIPSGAEALGSAAFKADHGCRMAYAAGSMYQGIASAALVRRMAERGLLAYLGSGGLGRDRLEPALAELASRLGPEAPWGANLLPDPREALCAELLEAYGVRRIEASAYVKPSDILVAWRLRGLSRGPDGRVVVGRKLAAKVSRSEVADRFLSPAPDDLVRELVAAGRVTAEQATLAQGLPLCDDLTAEADSGGHTDGRNPYALIPVLVRLRDRLAASVRVGAAGGIGTGEAAAAAFLLGADYVVTGSVNQCTPEAGTSIAAKDRLAAMGPEDTAYAPSGQYFETGARVQVLKKGTLFASRANTLYDIYRTHEAVEDLGTALQARIEGWFGVTLDQAWADCQAFWPTEELERADRAPKHKLALILRWYFGRSTRLALEGDSARAADFQIHCGPALGAFNDLVRGTALESWQARHADLVAEKIMGDAAALLQRAGLAGLSGVSGLSGHSGLSGKSGFSGPSGPVSGARFGGEGA